MKSPSRRGEVTKEWVEYMLTEYENKSSPGTKVTVKTWKTSDATNKGDGYQGDLLTLDVEATIQNITEPMSKEYQSSAEPMNKDYHHIIKFTSQDPIQKEFNNAFGNVEREILIYSDIIQELNKFQSKSTNNKFPICIPTFIFGRFSDEENVLVMENMKNHGYEIKPKTDFLSFDEAKVALEQLARLHAISYVYDKTHNITKKYPNISVQRKSKLFSSVQDILIDIAIEYLIFLEDYQDLSDKIRMSKYQILQKNKKRFEPNNGSDHQRIFCINHADPWNSNILVRQSENESENDSKSDLSVCFIDWEGARWNTSVYDLTYFFAGALTPEIRLKHLDELLHHYYDHFTEVTKQLRSPIPNWSYDDFKKEYDTLSLWGLVIGLGFSVTLSETSKEFQMSNHNPTTNPVIKYIKKIFGKVLVTILVNGSMLEKFTYRKMKKFKEPMLDEMKSGKNPELNKIFLENVLEADKRGFFDLLK